MSNNKIYIIKIFNKKENFIKLGFTKNKVKTRFKDSVFRYKVIRVIRHKDAETIERSIHRLMYRHRYDFTEKFEGYTECYPMAYLNDLHNLLNDFCGVKPKRKNRKYNRPCKEIMNNKGQLDFVDLSIYKP